MDRGTLTAGAQDWQRCWHAILDRNGVEMDGRPDTSRLPPIDDDIRLHFGFWVLRTDQGARIRREALELLPRGDAIADRVEHHFRTPQHRMERGEAVIVLRNGLQAVRDSGIEAPDGAVDIRVFDAGTVSYLDAFRQADSPFIGVGDTLWNRAQQWNGTVGFEAYAFLSEPLYRLASSYAVRDWAMWPLCSPGGEPDLTDPEWRLFKGGWVPGWDENGLFLFPFPGNDAIEDR